MLPNWKIKPSGTWEAANIKVITHDETLWMCVMKEYPVANDGFSNEKYIVVSVLCAGYVLCMNENLRNLR